jgi:hypothetical protein
MIMIITNTFIITTTFTILITMLIIITISINIIISITITTIIIVNGTTSIVVFKMDLSSSPPPARLLFKSYHHTINIIGPCKQWTSTGALSLPHTSSLLQSSRQYFLPAYSPELQHSSKPLMSQRSVCGLALAMCTGETQTAVIGCESTMASPGKFLVACVFYRFSEGWYLVSVVF